MVKRLKPLSYMSLQRLTKLNVFEGRGETGEGRR